MLPNTKTAPKTNFGALSTLIFADPKVGKSTWAANIPQALFIATEQGQNFLSVYKVDSKSWEDTIAICKELQAGKHEFKTLVIDTVDLHYIQCERFICKREGVESVADLEFGKGFAMVRAEYLRVMNALQMLGYGLVFISHSKEKEIKTKTQSYTMKVCSLSEKPATMIAGMCDFIFYAYIDEHGQRLMRTKPTKYILAGDRSGKLPELIPLNYDAFIVEFNKAVGKEENK